MLIATIRNKLYLCTLFLNPATLLNSLFLVFWCEVLQIMWDWGFPGGPAVKNLPANPGTRISPRVRKIPCRRKRQPPAALLPGESLGRRSLAGCRPRGCTVSVAQWLSASTCEICHLWIRSFHFSFLLWMPFISFLVNIGYW